MTLKQERHLVLKGSYNTRDLGGYDTVDGKKTRWGVFVRSDDVSFLSEHSQSKLIQYGIRTVVDLRSPEELAIHRNAFAESEKVAALTIDMAGDVGMDQDLPVAERIPSMYIELLEKRQNQIADILSKLASPGALPALYHCAGGQDRTGVISALLLGIACVPDNIIAEDYTLTANYRANVNPDQNPDVDPDTKLIETYRARNCPTDAMLRTTSYIRKKYGGYRQYMLETGVSTETIEKLYQSIVE